MHISHFHYDNVIRDTPEKVLTMVWWRCKAGVRRIGVDCVTELIGELASHHTDDLKTEIFEIVAAALNLAQVRVGNDCEM